MSDSNDNKPYRVGYGKPPVEHRFKPGRSGNARGGKKKGKDALIDIEATLERPVVVTRDGKTVAMDRREVALLSQVKKALAGNLPALTHVLDKAAKHGLIGTDRDTQPSGVVALPSTMPFAMACDLAHRFGPPPWTKQQITTGRERYLLNRSEAQAREDDAIGYPDL